jgi:hypothetical protein
MLCFLLPLCPQCPCSLYLRTFGATNHEVKTTADGQLETIRPIEGRFYRLNLLQSVLQDKGVLVVTEIDPTQPDMGRLELQLLDPGADDGCGGWGSELPVRLRQMHSHWFDRCVCTSGLGWKANEAIKRRFWGALPPTMAKDGGTLLMGRLFCCPHPTVLELLSCAKHQLHSHIQALGP